MKITATTKRALAFRRQHKALTAAGYRMHETDWEIQRGALTHLIIKDAIISVDGKHVYTKLGHHERDHG